MEFYLYNLIKIKISHHSYFQAYDVVLGASGESFRIWEQQTTFGQVIVTQQVVVIHLSYPIHHLSCPRLAIRMTHLQSYPRILAGGRELFGVRHKSATIRIAAVSFYGIQIMNRRGEEQKEEQYAVREIPEMKSLVNLILKMRKITAKFITLWISQITQQVI